MGVDNLQHSGVFVLRLDVRDLLGPQLVVDPVVDNVEVLQVLLQSLGHRRGQHENRDARVLPLQVDTDFDYRRVLDALQVDLVNYEDNEVLLKRYAQYVVDEGPGGEDVVTRH